MPTTPQAMKTFFKELFEYNHHCNQKLGDIFNNNPDKTSERAIQLYNHICNVHQLWNSRIEHQQPTSEIWDMHPIQDYKRIDKTSYEHSLLLLDKYELNQIINYTNYERATI